MTAIKYPQEIALDVLELPKYKNLTDDDLGLLVEEIAIKAIEADRAQRPALEQWFVFEVGYPNVGETFNCDEATAEEIARAYGADENNCGKCYGYRKIGA